MGASCTVATGPTAQRPLWTQARSPPLAALNSDVGKKRSPPPKEHFSGRQNISLVTYSFNAYDGPGALTTAVRGGSGSGSKAALAAPADTAKDSFVPAEVLEVAAPLSPVDNGALKAKPSAAPHNASAHTTDSFSISQSFKAPALRTGASLRDSFSGADYDNIVTLPRGSGTRLGKPHWAPLEAASATAAATAIPAPPATAADQRRSYYLVQPREESPVRAPRPVPQPPARVQANRRRHPPPEAVMLLMPSSPERTVRGAASAPPALDTKAVTTTTVAAVEQPRAAAGDDALRMSTDSFAEGFFCSTIPSTRMAPRETNKTQTSGPAPATTAMAEPQRPSSSGSSASDAPRGLLDTALAGADSPTGGDQNVEQYSMSAGNFHSIFGSYFLLNGSTRSLLPTATTTTAAPAAGAKPTVSDEAALHQLLQSAVRSNRMSQREKDASVSKQDDEAVGASRTASFTKRDKAESQTGADGGREIFVTGSGDLFQLISAIHQNRYVDKEDTVSTAPSIASAGKGKASTPRGRAPSVASSSPTEEDEEDMVVVEFHKILDYHPSPARETPAATPEKGEQKDSQPKRRVSEARDLEKENSWAAANSTNEPRSFLTFAPQRVPGAAAHRSAPNTPLQHLTPQQQQARGRNSSYPTLPFGATPFNRFAPMPIHQPLHTRPHATGGDIVPHEQNASLTSAFNSKQQQYNKTKTDTLGPAQAPPPAPQRRISGDSDNFSNAATNAEGKNTKHPRQKKKSRVTKVIFLQKEE